MENRGGGFLKEGLKKRFVAQLRQVSRRLGFVITPPLAPVSHWVESRNLVDQFKHNQRTNMENLLKPKGVLCLKVWIHETNGQSVHIVLLNTG